MLKSGDVKSLREIARKEESDSSNLFAEGAAEARRLDKLASGIGFLLARHVFDIAFTFNSALLAYGIVWGRPRGHGLLRAHRDAAGIEQSPIETLRRV
jgi:hypothetical protein